MTYLLAAKRDLKEQLSRLADGLTDVAKDLQAISRGMHGAATVSCPRPHEASRLSRCGLEVSALPRRYHREDSAMIVAGVRKIELHQNTAHMLFDRPSVTQSRMGHVAIATKKPHQMRAYYNTVFDARLSDYIDETISGLKFKIRFLRVNERHHTVAIASVSHLPLNPIRTRIQHCNIQVAELDDMTASYQRVKELGFHMALSVGQRTNDKELSYYALTPSGFEWEVGWNPIVVDESTWEITTHQGISIWGHTPEGHTLIQLLERLKTTAQSVLHAEDSVPALAGSGIADAGKPTRSRIQCLLRR